MTAVVPGLLIAPQPGRYGTWQVTHATSGTPLFFDCAGDAAGSDSALFAAQDAARVLDWTMTERDIYAALDTRKVLELERIAARFGAACYQDEPAPGRVSA